jgi:serine/threonine-protein kinase
VAADQDNAPRAFAEVAIELGLCDDRKVRDALLVKQKLGEMGVHRTLEEILVERGYISEEGIKQVEKALKGDNRLGGFELVEKVGAGAMGAVFRARQVSLDRIVALKILPRHLAEDPSFVNRFLREARNVAKLNHPNIIQGIDVGEAKGYYYFAMEYIDGPNVRTVVDEKGPMSEKDALQVLLGAAKGLEHAWKNSILHRDIKPANLMITSENVVKLCDLGLATARGPEADASGSSVGKAVGTPYYISPEQATGEKDVDTRSDIYSLGATLYHMLSGHPPFEGNPSAVVLAKHLKDRVQPLSRTDVSRNTQMFLGKMMAKDRKERHQTPTEVIEDIEDLIAAKPPRYSVRFRGESTFPIPGALPQGRATGKHAVVQTRHVKGRPVQKSSSVSMLILIFLFLALAGVVAWQASIGKISIPGLMTPTPEPPPPPSEPVFVQQPAGPVVQPATQEPPKTIQERDNTALKATLAQIASDLKEGRMGPEDARIRLDAFAAQNPKHGLDREVGAIQSEIERQNTERREALANALADVKKLVADGEFDKAADALDTLTRNGFTSADVAPAKDALVAAYDKEVDSVEDSVKAALASNNIAGARQAYDKWAQRQAGALRIEEIAARTKKIEDAIKAKEARIAEMERDKLVKLAEALHEVRAAIRAGKPLLPEEIGVDVPQGYLKALLREAEKAVSFTDEIARKVGNMGTASVPYRSTRVTGKTSYAGSGHVKVRTREGLEIVIAMLDVPSETVMEWSGLTGNTAKVQKVRFITFSGLETVPENLPLGTEAENPDLVLLLKALKAQKEAEVVKSIREKLQALNPDTADMASLQTALTTLEELQASGTDARDLADLQAKVRSELVKRVASLFGAKGKDSKYGVTVVYDTADPQPLGDWTGIDGGWTWSVPGLNAKGGKLAHLVLWAKPLHLNLLIERRGGVLTADVGGLQVSIDSQGTKVVTSDGVVLAEGPSPGTGRIPVDITLEGSAGRLDVGADIRLTWKMPPGKEAGSPIAVTADGLSLWGITIEGTPISGEGASALAQLAAARKKIETGQKATWPILPGLPGWLAEKGTWRLGDTGYLETRDSSEVMQIRAAIKVPTPLAIEGIYRQHNGNPTMAKNGGIGVVSGLTSRLVVAASRAVVGRWTLVSRDEQQTRGRSSSINDEQDYKIRVEAFRNGNVSFSVDGDKKLSTDEALYVGDTVTFGFYKMGVANAFKDLTIEPLPKDVVIGRGPE